MLRQGREGSAACEKKGHRVRCILGRFTGRMVAAAQQMGFSGELFAPRPALDAWLHRWLSCLLLLIRLGGWSVDLFFSALPVHSICRPCSLRRQLRLDLRFSFLFTSMRMAFCGVGQRNLS